MTKKRTPLDILLREGGSKTDRPRSYIEIAYKNELGEATVRNWARGRTIPRLDVTELAKMLRYLGVSLDEFAAATEATLKEAGHPKTKN